LQHKCHKTQENKEEIFQNEPFFKVGQN
jgi:hypothetical protein